MRANLLACCAVFAALGSALPRTALGDDLPAGTAPPDPASTGSTDVAGGGKFEEAAAKPDDKDKDMTQAQILGGGLLSTGNSRSLSATGAAQFRFRRDANQLSVGAAANYARAAATPADSVEPTVENYQGKVRYDRFIASEFALFLSVAGRRDRFQKLNFRLNVDPGAAYYFVDEASQELWGELGYDFQFDLNDQSAVDAGSPATAVTHSGRVFAGYHNTLNEAVAFTTGLEYLQGISDTSAYRINFDAGLTSKIAGNFSLATTFSLKYNHQPLPGVKDTDTTTALSLVYQLL